MKTFEIIKVDPQGYCGGVLQAIAIAKVTVMDKNMVNAEMQKGPNTGDSGILVALLSLAVASIALVLINRAKVNK